MMTSYKYWLLTGSLFCWIGSALHSHAAIVTLDFENAPTGKIHGSLKIPSKYGGEWTLTTSSAGQEYVEIVEIPTQIIHFDPLTSTTTISEGIPDRRLRIYDIGAIPGTTKVEIRHSSGMFVPLPGGRYRAADGLNRGSFQYLRLPAIADVLGFSNSFLVNHLQSTFSPNGHHINMGFFNTPQAPASSVSLNANGLYTENTTLQLDIDNLQFDIAIPEPHSAILLLIGSILICNLRVRRI